MIWNDSQLTGKRPAVKKAIELVVEIYLIIKTWQLDLFTLLSVMLLLVVALLPQLSLSKPKKENRQPKEENQKP